jgi:protein TonB
VIGAERPPRSLAMPIACSALLHVGVIGSIIFLHPPGPQLMPPMYKVNLIAAPPGPRAVGEVTTAPPPPTPPQTPPKAAAKAPPPPVPIKSKAKPLPKVPVKATPNIVPEKQAPPRTAPAPKAGGGAVGSNGADVATVRTEGIDFPYPGYLDNIVRQIALNFAPRGNVGALRAEVFFMVHRDGSVSGFRFLTRSGSQAFDLECQGAVEASARGFGALPAGFTDDVLPVIFSFDPSKLR